MLHKPSKELSLGSVSRSYAGLSGSFSLLSISSLCPKNSNAVNSALSNLCNTLYTFLIFYVSTVQQIHKQYCKI